MSVWVIVAAYNEAARLGDTLDGVVASWPNVVVVDDGSTDETRAVAFRHPVWLVPHPINCGQGAALRTGITFALEHGADVIVTFDADGQHDAADIAAVVAPVIAGRVDIAFGSRFFGRTIDMPTRRRVLLVAARWFTRIVSGVAIMDPQNGLRAMSRAAAERIRITQDRMAHASELIDQLRTHRLRWCEVPVTVRYTADTLAKGQSSWNAVRIVGELITGRVIK